MLYEKTIKVTKFFKFSRGHNFTIYKTYSYVGDKNGGLGYGVSKSRDQLFSLNKSLKNARKNFIRVSYDNLKTIPYEIYAKYCKSKILLIPSLRGGLITNNYLKILFNLIGIKNIISKIYGSNNFNNIIIAVISSLNLLKSSYYYNE